MDKVMNDHRRPAARQPTDTPRKQAMRTTLVKNVRNTTVLPNQRMQASSKKRIKKLTPYSSAYVRSLDEGDSTSAVAVGEVDMSAFDTWPPKWSSRGVTLD